MGRGRSRYGACVALALASSFGCPVADKPGECLSLPGAVRHTLVADPRARALYWMEPVRGLDFDADQRSYLNLVRYDLRARHREVILDHVLPPLHVVNDNLLVRRSTGMATWLARIAPDGTVQALTPDELDVIDVEVIDPNTLAVLADGDGARAVYTIELDRPRPHHLIDADILLSTAFGRVFVVSDETGIGIDWRTGQRQPTFWTKGGSPQGSDLWYVADAGVKAHGMSSRDDRTVVPTRASWDLRHQAGSVLARTPPKDGRSRAVLLSGGAATELPTVVGGASILGTARLGQQIWALVGHNTANYERDLGLTDAEADVCLLPKAAAVSFPTRTIPRRFVGVEDRLRLARAREAADATLQVLDGDGGPTTVYIDLKKESGGADFAKMRARTRELHERVTSILGELEARTLVTFADGRTGVHRWRRDRLRYRTSIGIGDALLSDPRDFDVELRDSNNVKTGDQILCAGTLVNLLDRRLENLEIRCIAGDRTQIIAVSALEPAASHAFSQTFSADEHASPSLQVFAGREPLVVRTMAYEAQAEKVYEIAARVVTETRLVLDEHEVGDELSVNLNAPRDFPQRTDAERLLAATKAFQQLEALRSVYELRPDTPLVLHLQVDLSELVYDFDGQRLELAN